MILNLIIATLSDFLISEIEDSKSLDLSTNIINRKIGTRNRPACMNMNEPKVYVRIVTGGVLFLLLPPGIRRELISSGLLV